MRPLLPGSAKTKRRDSMLRNAKPASEPSIASQRNLAAPRIDHVAAAPLKAHRPERAAAQSAAVVVCSSSDSSASDSDPSECGSDTDTPAQLTGVGFKNCGNTCYAAAMLQLRIARCPFARKTFYRRRKLCNIESALLVVIVGAAALKPALAPFGKLWGQCDPTEFWISLTDAVARCSDSPPRWAEGHVSTQSWSTSPKSCRHVLLSGVQTAHFPKPRGSPRFPH